jgi:hypothetical protein
VAAPYDVPVRLYRGVVAAALLTLVVSLALLVMSQLPPAFFEAYGAVVGPLSWLVCTVLTGTALGLPLARTLGAALFSGVAAVLVMVTLGHAAGIVAGVLVFALLAALPDRHRVSRGGGDRTRVLRLERPAS